MSVPEFFSRIASARRLPATEKEPPMERINVTNKVQVIAIKPGEQPLLNKVGTVMMITDGVNCFLTFEDGSFATVNINQLKKI
jgi:hypothetical protein